MYKSRIVVMVLMLMLLSINLLGQKGYGFLPPVSVSAVAETRSSICVPNPANDTQWDRSKSFEVQVNDAIDAENIAFGKSYPDYNHPTYNSSDAFDISAKVLKELRRVYQGDGIADIDIEYDLSVIDMATDHSCAMDLDNTFCHSCPSDGSFGQRIVNRIGSGCYRSGTENIAWISTQDMEQSILRIIYLMMYTDVDCCDNGHRENFLKCTYDNNTKVGFGIIRGDLQSSNGTFVDSWIMTWDYVTYRSYPACGDGCNCNVSIGTPLCSASQGSVLPVDLSSFTVSSSDCNYANIEWVTESEVNNDYFIVERSLDGVTWRSIGSIESGIKNNQLQDYNLQDDLNNISEDKVYYRLSQIDLNGLVDKSDIVSLVRDCQSTISSLYPNPSDKFVNIRSLREIISITIYDLSGQLIETSYDKSSNRISTGHLMRGIYLVELKNDIGEVEVLRMVKQ